MKMKWEEGRRVRSERKTRIRTKKDKEEEGER